MPLQTSGAISLNDLHVEAGGTSGTQASINDSDIRALISKASGAQSTFSGFYGASSSILSTTMTIGTFDNSVNYGGVNYGYNDHTKSALFTNSWGSMANRSVNSIQSGAIISQLNYNNLGGTIQFILSDNTAMSNSGWTSITIGSTTINRTAASFVQQTTTISGYGHKSVWTWSAQGSTSPYGTSGTVSVTIV